MRRSKLLFSSILATVLGMGVIGGVLTTKNTKEVKQVEAATVSKDRIVLELEDQCWSTNDGRNATLHIWNISVDDSMEYDTTDLKSEFDAASAINDFETGHTGRSLNNDGSIDTGFTWDHQDGNNRYYVVNLPWYITGFTFKVKCGDAWSKYERTVTKRGSHMLYQYGSWNDFTTDITQDASGKSHSYNVTNYAITAASSGGVSSDGHTAQVKGNGGSYTTSGNYFPRQKISLKATAGTYSAFDHWSSGDDTSSATTFDYVGTAAKTYTATFSDTRSKFTVVFKDEDGTTLETKTNVYQGSSVSPTSTPTKADEGGKQFAFSKWVSSTGVDMTSSLANVQSDLTVYASYTITYKTGRYIAGNFPAGTEDDWKVSGGIYMTGTSNPGEYLGTVTLAFGDHFKSAYYNGTSLESYYGYSYVTANCGAYHYFTNNYQDNIVCYARGTYRMYFTDYDYGDSKKISLELVGSLNAEHLAALLMSFNVSEGYCGDNDRFPAMKTIFIGLTSAEQTTFKGYVSSETSQFKNAYDRYVAWASALGENPWAAGKLSVRFSVISGINPENTSTALIVIIASTVTILSVGGYFLLRRKKQK